MEEIHMPNPKEIQRIGDGRIIIDGNTYCNESSNRVLTIKQQKEYSTLKEQNEKLNSSLGYAENECEQVREQNEKLLKVCRAWLNTVGTWELKGKTKSVEIMIQQCREMYQEAIKQP